MIEWRIKGREFANCNCSYGCPCQFNALPTHGNCEAILAVAIDEGHFGGVKLDGLHAAGIYRWPGAVHEGNGTMQLVVDERAEAPQREALLKIMQGEETEPMMTMWAVYTAMTTTVLEPLARPIEFEVDVEERRARLVVPGLIETTGEPIRNPVTGAPSRARIDKPEGFEFTLAEIGSGTTKTTGAIALDLQGTYGQFAEIHLTHKGVVRDAA